ncbi:hypothetical protein HDV03_005554 [Kappamyces sp. JEL0829]|nr:hypothetical protein HDV03_005554 [Kappamyces sp. JEL0829]
MVSATTLVLLLIIFYLSLKFILLPFAIPKIIRRIPLDKDPHFHVVHLKEFTARGIEARINVTIPYTKLPLPWLWVQATLPAVTIKDFHTGRHVGTARLSNPICVTGYSDLNVNQDRLCVDVAEGVPVLRQFLQGILVGGQREIDRITFEVFFVLDISICGLLTCHGIKCSKLINLGESEQQKKKHRLYRYKQKMNRFQWNEVLQKSLLTSVLGSEEKHVLEPCPTLVTPEAQDEHTTLDQDHSNEQDGSEDLETLERLQEEEEARLSKTSRSMLSLPDIPVIAIPAPDLFQDLFPNPEIQPFVNPGLSIHAGLEISFSRPPGFLVSCGRLTYDSLLNGMVVAKVVVDPFFLSPTATKATYTLHVTHAAISSPISGSISSVRSILRGVMGGVGQGILYQEWGAKSTVLGVRNIVFQDACGNSVPWIDELVKDLEVEQDLDLVRFLSAKAMERTPDLNLALKELAGGIMRQANCSIM